MRQKLVLTGLFTLALIIASACDTNLESQDNAADNSTPEQDDQLIYYESGNISFSYPSFIAGTVSFERIEASIEDAFIGHPEYEQLIFEDYFHSDTRLSSLIRIFPLEEYRLLSDDTAATIDQLEAITADKEIQANITELPYLPWPMAAQQFYANIGFLEANAGSGLRYLTQYIQDMGPVTNQGLFYTYQGITADQKYYVSAVFPVNHPELPLDWDDFFISTGTDYETFEKNYADYMDLTVKMLDESDAGAFMPSLKLFDDIIKSLQTE